MSTPGATTLLYRPDDPRLGRHVHHDPQNRDYDVRALLLSDAPPRVLTEWRRHGPVFNQGACPPETLRELGADPSDVTIGCCTLDAAYGLLLTEPFCHGQCAHSIADVLRGYHRVTELDEAAVPGVWPPTDTGSTGQHAMRVLRERGLIQAYRWAFRMNTALSYLAHGPFALGTAWYDSMFTLVDRDGLPTLEISPDAAVVGGHEYVVDGIDPSARRVRVTNSWGADWGRLGHAWMSYPTLERLLGERGDVVVPVVRPRLPGLLSGSMSRASSRPGTPGLGHPG